MNVIQLFRKKQKGIKETRIRFFMFNVNIFSSFQSDLCVVFSSSVENNNSISTN